LSCFSSVATRQADNLTIEYVLRFESSPPAWIDYKDDGGSALSGADGCGRANRPLPDVIDANVVKVLEQLKNYSAQHQSLTLDRPRCAKSTWWARSC
jgi:hypothetical protein